VQAGSSIAKHSYSDHALPVALLHCLADQGRRDAQLELARRYEFGEGVAPDLAVAVQLYERAAMDAPGTNAIYSPPVHPGGSGRVLLLGNRAARAGSADARYRLGLMLIEGRGVARDLRRGRSLMERAAGAGHSAAQQWLSTTGQDGPKSLSRE
jgi:hypothetical protein